MLTVQTIREGTFEPSWLDAHRLKVLLNENLIDRAIASRCSKSQLKEVERKLMACFPGDALRAIQGFQALTHLLRSKAPIENRYQEYIRALGFDGLVDATALTVEPNFKPLGVSTLAAREHFRYLPQYSQEEWQELKTKGVWLLHDLIVTAHHSTLSEQGALLTRAVSIFRLLGYLIKHREKTHFYCPDEYDVFCRIKVEAGKIVYDPSPGEPLESKSANLRFEINRRIGFKRTVWGPRQGAVAEVSPLFGDADR